MIDLSGLAKKEKTIRKHTDELLISLKLLGELRYVDKNLYDLIYFACEYHDYGKINEEFQKRIKSHGKLSFNNSREVAHNVLSTCFLPKSKFENIEDYYRVCYAIMNHHHHTKNFEEYDNKEHLIKEFAKKYGVKKINPFIISELRDFVNDKKMWKIKGILHKCDYAASGEYDIEYPNDFLEDSLENLGYDWRPLQKFCKDNRESNLMVIANTGMGKTEAGLLWIGDTKGFFILPLRTAINAIYDRVRTDIVKENIKKRVSLLHSDTVSYYIDKEVTEEENVLEYARRSRRLNMPLTISTLDQLFNFVYKYNGFELKLATLSYSKLVIDEIQAYSPDLLSYLVLGLEKITEMGGKFAILTATLPPFVRDYIQENIPNIKFTKFTEGKDRHNIEVKDEEINSEFIYKKFKEKGGKFLVVCNTVKKSQKIYAELKAKNDDLKIHLLHAKFIKNHRSKKEDEIIKFGKTKVTGDEIWVATSLVEASLDIDFDYLITELNDLNGFFQRLGRVNREGEKAHMLNEPNAYLFTKISRNLFTIKNPSNNLITRGFIDETIFNLSKTALESHGNGILKENEKAELIEEYFTTENIKDSNFDESYKGIKKYIDDLYIGEKVLEDVKRDFRNIAAFNAIPESIYNNLEVRELIEENLVIINSRFKKDKNISDEENKKNKKKHTLSQIKAAEEIKGYTVSLGACDLNLAVKTPIRINKEEIFIVKCNYDDEIGFVRIKRKRDEETFDAFI